MNTSFKNTLWFLANLSLSCLAVIALCLAGELTLRYIWTEWKNDRDTHLQYQQKCVFARNVFRKDLSYYPDKKINTVRIGVFGDSFTHGDGIADINDIYTSVLEAKLQARYPRIGIQVINLGLQGFTTMNEYELLLRYGKKLELDMVVFQFLSNDTQISIPGFGHLETMAEFKIRLDLLKESPLRNWLIGNSYLYTFLNHKFVWLQIKYKVPVCHGFNDDYLGWKQFFKTLPHITGYCSALKIGRPLMVMFPGFLPGKWSLDTYPEKPAYDKAGKAAADAGLYVLDLSPVFINTGRNLKDFWASPLDFHPNRAANALAAQAIYGFFIENRTIDNIIALRLQALRTK